MQAGETRGGSGKLWVPVVLLVGILLGIVLSALPTPATPTSAGRGFGFHLQASTPSDFDVILSTVGIVLLVALLVVYARVYGETRASFALGLLVVLMALLLQSLLASPLLYGVFGETAGDVGTFLAIADMFKVVAFTVFLYLSLE